MADGLLLTAMNPPVGGDDEFNAWADTEHLPERRVIPGIRTAMRFRNQAPSPRYMALYDLEDLDVLGRPAYRAIAGDNLTPWSKRILAGATDRWRFEGTRIDATQAPSRTGARGRPVSLLLVQWRGLEEARDDAVVSVLRGAATGTPGLLQWRAFRGQRDGKTDYVGIVEASQPLQPAFTTPSRFSAPALPVHSASIFTPI